MLIAAAKVKELAAMKRIDYANLFPQVGLKFYAEQEGEDHGGGHYKSDDQYDIKLGLHGKSTCGETCAGPKIKVWPSLWVPLRISGP